LEGTLAIQQHNSAEEYMRFTAPTARALPAPAQLLTGLFAALLSTFVGSGCGELDGVGSSDQADDGSLRGTLVGYTSDDVAEAGQTRYFLRDRSGAERRLVFDAVIKAEDLQPETEVRVWGHALPDAFHVTSVETHEAEIARVSSALRNQAPYAPRSFAFVMLDMGGGVNTTADAAMGRLITAPDSIRNYYLSDSYGTQDVTAQVFGPMPYSMGNTCATSQLASTMRAMIPGTFQHYLWYFGNRQTACTWTGLASVGSPDKPSRDTWYNASTSCVVLVQEPGHNFGMQHSSSIACPNGATMADDPNTCTASEYGDPFDPMGGGCRHMNAWQKDYQGWFGGCNGVNVTSSGSFTILPIEQRCDGVQFLKIKAPKDRIFNRPAAGGGGATMETFSHYYVELRTPQDFDGTLGNRSALAPMVLVHIGGDRRGRNQRGLHTFLLDMTPATTGSSGRADSALGVGKTYTDPAGGLSITVKAVSGTQATVDVEIANGAGGGPTCLDDTPFTAPGPGQESCSAAMMTGAAGTGGNNNGSAGTGGNNNGAAGTGGNNNGAAGTNGNNGAAGTGGIPNGGAGTSGAAGTGLVPTGVAGTGGSATGAAGTSGLPPVTGVAGASGTPTGGTGTSAPHEAGETVVGQGCACDTSGSTPGGGAFAMLLLAGAFARARRRRVAAS
jgi:MYXO-CTERM domain-containing protein